jgi:thiol-disulfide isomerase/thioredoxin
LLLNYTNVFSQKKEFDLTLKLDDSIDAKNISCRYYNGRDEVFINDTFINNSLRLTGRFFSRYVSFHIEYRINNGASFTNEFFIDNTPAKIDLKFQQNEPNNKLRYNTIVNAIPIYDTSKNQFFKELAFYRAIESEAVSDFWQKNAAEIFRNDSIFGISKTLFKKLNNSTISFLRKHPHDYLSFWYFRKQVVEPSLTFFAKEKPYLNSLLDTMKNIFSKKIIESAEGQLTVKHIYNVIAINDPPKLNTTSPWFKSKDITGRQFSINEYRGKYVLLDFWASWCGPCIREIPFINQLRNEYSTDKLEIIGINDDREIDDLKLAIIKYGINWTNVFDIRKKISNLFGIQAIPVTILINSEGNIIYDSRANESKTKLIELLKRIN